MVAKSNKYKVYARAYDRKTGKPIVPERAETINTKTNRLFSPKMSILEIHKAYESFWNDLNPHSKDIVLVREVTRIKNKKTDMISGGRIKGWKQLEANKEFKSFYKIKNGNIIDTETKILVFPPNSKYNKTNKYLVQVTTPEGGGSKFVAKKDVDKTVKGFSKLRTKTDMVSGYKLKLLRATQFVTKRYPLADDEFKQKKIKKLME